MKVLVTCPPMLGMIDSFRPLFREYGAQITTPKVVQTLTVEELTELVPHHDGWIIGDDPATREVFLAGSEGRLRAAVKWGVGTDNVDFKSCEEFGIKVTNTPGMFGHEVADIAHAYVIALARHIVEIDRGVRSGDWPKPQGISLQGKKMALLGYGDIGFNIANRALASGMSVSVYDPFASRLEREGITFREWPQCLDEADFLVVSCALTDDTRHILNDKSLNQLKPGVRIVNVSRGSIIDEVALEEALKSGRVHSVALDVFETEPLPSTSYLRSHSHCVLGSHNGSNTVDAVVRTSELAIERLINFLA